MLHVSTDRLAELGDAPPSAAEAAHLALCADCATERAAYRSLVAMARAERQPLGLPLTRWDAIAAELARETGADVVSIAGQRATKVRRWPLQAAAALLLLAGGVMAGRTSAGATPIPGDRVTGVTATAAEVDARVARVARLAGDSVAFASVAEARAAQLEYEHRYQQATAFLAEHDSGATQADSPVAVRSRLAALDQVLSTMGEATRQAPHDPVINGYYLTTLGQREATLRQLNTSLPTSLRVNSF